MERSGLGRRISPVLSELNLLHHSFLYNILRQTRYLTQFILVNYRSAPLLLDETHSLICISRRREMFLHSTSLHA